MTSMRAMALTLVLSVVVAALGAWGGAAYVLHQARHRADLHEVLHEKLHLTATQQAQIEGIEQQHAARRRELEAEMRAANADLAKAFQAQHAYTPQVQAAIDRLHMAMGALQKETMVHVLAMRAVLTPQQAAQFDDTVVRSLTEDQR